MPAPIREAILAPEITRFRVDAEPVVNALQSLMMLTRIDKLSGLDNWVIEAASSLSEEAIHRNMLVLFGLHNALAPDQQWPSFPAYIRHLETIDPVQLRDKVIDAYLDIPCQKGNPKPGLEEILESEDGFLEFLRCRFDDELIMEEIEREAYQLLTQPEKMREVITTHFKTMWDEVLREEWDRSLPLINESVAAFQEVDLSRMTDAEAMHFVTGHSSEKWTHLFESVESMVFVPSTHMGPYLGVFHNADTAWIIFGARQPQGVEKVSSNLSRAELLVWLSALSDETRLHILALIQERGELCAQEIIDLLELSQSTCSRHLRQLTASGYLRERRIEAGKCYSLNPERLLETARTIEGLATT
jgi:ArsR family transcriptional regulator